MDQLAHVKKYAFTTLVNLLIYPLVIITTIVTAHLFFRYTPGMDTFLQDNVHFDLMEQSGFLVCLWLSCYWLIARLIDKASRYALKTSFFCTHHVIRLILPLLLSGVKIIVFLSLFNFFSQYLSLPPTLSFLLVKIASILIICAISWMLFKLTDLTEQLLINRYPDAQVTAASRKVYTQTLILKRIAYSIIGIITVGSVLMLFENVRTLGASVLTTAGIVGLVLTFTAQRSLSSIFSGLELALTQPIKIGDAVMIQNEFGTVETISFRNVVIKLWDWRRLIVPTSYFLENAFQNWSHEQNTNLIGTVYLYADFTLPVPAVREELKNLLKNSPYWDGHVCALSVDDLQERVMKLKILASAVNADSANNLRNELREKLIHFIITQYPDALPKDRRIAMAEA